MPSPPTKRFLGIALPKVLPAGDPRTRPIEALAVWCEQFSPTVAIDAGDVNGNIPASLLLDVTRLGPLFGGEAALADRVVRQFRARGIAVRVAIADTVAAAWAVAHANSGGSHDAHTSIVPPGKTRAALAPLPLGALRLDAPTVDLLRQLGLACVGDVLRLPRAALRQRFGPQLPRRLEQALGEVAEVLVPCRHRPEPEASWDLDPPLADRTLLEHVLEHLLQRIGETLAAREQGALRLELRIACEGGAKLTLEVGLFQPNRTPSYLLELLRLRWEQTTLPQAVEQLSIVATHTAAIVPRQGELFPAAATTNSRDLARLADRLASRLGDRAVLRPRPVATAQPELACRYAPLVAASRSSPQNPSPRKPPARSDLAADRGPLHRPLRLRSPPTRLAVIAIAPAGPPIRFQEGRDTHLVHRHWGPERIETSWWRNRTLRRDYYRIETHSGRRFWLFRNLHNGEWFLHGDFD